MRDQEHAVLLPLERLLWGAVAGPDGREAATLDDVDDLVEREALRRKRLARRDLRDAGLAHTLLAGEDQERGVAFTLRPRAHLDRPRILNEIATMNGHT